MKVHFTTLGCPKNQVDSELMLGMLTRAGHEIVDAAEGAECLVVNTCAFIDRAREESVNTILELAQLKERGRARSLIVTGCLTQRYGGEILKEIPEVNAILGTSELDRIVALVNQADGRRDWVTSAPPGYLYDAKTPRLLTARLPYAYVKIAEGCDMGCTFCAIPQFRGKHRSRPQKDIVAEVEGLAARGIQEAILVSQDTLAYGRDLPGNGDIGDLLLALSDTTMPWIRPMYLHPAHVNDRLIGKWRQARVVPYLDMPVQHGDDGVLKAMRRAITARRMKDVIAGFREAIPGLTLRTTVLVGFPGETERAFDNLLAFVEDVAFDRLGVFTYSRRGGHAGGGHGGSGARRGDGRARGPRPGDAGPARLAAPEGALRHAPDRAGGRAERGPRLSLRGAAGGPGARDRRCRVAARPPAHAGALRGGVDHRGRRLRIGRGE